jgi:hypothetical protein
MTHRGDECAQCTARHADRCAKVNLLIDYVTQRRLGLTAQFLLDLRHGLTVQLHQQLERTPAIKTESSK